MEQPRKILLAGRLRDEVAEYLGGKGKGFEFRVGDYHEIGQGDLEWADVYVAFRPVEGLDMGAVKWVHALGAGVDENTGEFRAEDRGVLFDTGTDVETADTGAYGRSESAALGAEVCGVIGRGSGIGGGYG